MSTTLRLLLLEDNLYDAELMIATLEEAGYVCHWERVETRTEFLAHLDSHASDYDLILADYNLPAFDGLTALELFRERNLDLPFVLVSGTLGEERAIESLKAGATDYVLKVRLSRLGPVVRRALREKEEQRQLEHAEEALKRSEAKYRTLFHSIADPIFIFDQETQRFLDCNQAALDRYGYSREELRTMTPYRLHPPEDWGEVEKNIIDEENNLAHYYTHITKSGQRLQVEVHSAPLEYNGRKAWISIVRDITERKRAEEALRASEKKQRDLVDNALVGIYRSNLLGEILYVNEALLRISGFDSLDEMNAFGLVNLYNDPKDRESFLKQLQQMGKIDGLEIELLTKKGEVINVLISAVPEGEVLSGMIVDITEHKRAEAEREQLLTRIQEQAQRVQQIVDTVPEGVLLLDADGRIVLANPVANGQLSVLADARVGDTITCLGDCPLQELLIAPPEGLWHEVTAGSRKFEVIARSISSEHEEAAGWVLVVRDVTHEREIQHRIQQQERLAAVGQLAAGIAHDFNNIMAVIVLYTQIVLRTTPDLLPNARNRLATVVQQAKQASDLIQQILDFSRSAVIERQPLNLVPLLKEQVKLLERTLPENIHMELTYGADEYIVNADPTRIQQAIMNLALNARDAMPNGGELRFALEQVCFEDGRDRLLPKMEFGHEAWVQVTVSDTGGGISSDVLPHIYEPFFTTKERGKGSGLGLAQVYGIVKQHEGDIDVQSQMGQGTTFKIYLPALTTYSLAMPDKDISTLVKGQGEIILVVEDDAATRGALVSSLELLNYRVLEAINGQEALVALEDHGRKIALVLSDLVMPRMGGAALLRNLKQRALTVPVVMLTGHPVGEEISSLQAQGTASLLKDWLFKPPTLEQLAEVVDRVLKESL